jgi:hypothetical protein
VEEPNEIVKEIKSMQERYKDRLHVEYLVDEENSWITKKTVSEALSSSNDSDVDGRKIILVSGPEGFITHFAGPKKWWQGKEVSGDVGGVMRELGVEGQGWEVMKL